MRQGAKATATLRTGVLGGEEPQVWDTTKADKRRRLVESPLYGLNAAR